MKDNSSSFDDKYLHVLQSCVNGMGREVRQGVQARSIGARSIQTDVLLDGFPIVTTKWVPYRLVRSELFWFMSGSQELLDLVEDENYIWVGDAYSAYESMVESPIPKEDFVSRLKSDTWFNNKHGYMGKIYGPMWRGRAPAHGHVDQLHNAIKQLNIEPYSRRNLTVSWDPSIHQTGYENKYEAALPPCHYAFQFTVHPVDSYRQGEYEQHDYITGEAPEKRLDLTFVMRSTDVALGLPFNLASYGTLLRLAAREAGMVPGKLTCFSGDMHVYESHLEGAREQLSQRGQESRVRLNIDTEKAMFDESKNINIEQNDVKLENYQPSPETDKIEFPLET
jgi:thymidylate synthase